MQSPQEVKLTSRHLTEVEMGFKSSTSDDKAHNKAEQFHRREGNRERGKEGP